MSPECKHTAVMPDPVLGDWCCCKCFKSFRQIPDVDNDLPRISTLWQCIKWAFKPRKKVAVLPFGWTVEWAKLREQRHPQWQPHWSNKQTPRTFTPADAAKLYTHPGSSSNLIRLTKTKPRNQ